MSKLKKKSILIVGCIILLILLYHSYNLLWNKSDSESTISIQESIRLKNIDVDEGIRNSAANGNYSFLKPLILENPYDISPLTAVIAFITNEKTSIREIIKGDTPQDTLQYDFPEATIHIIPAVGLYADRTNHIILQKISDDKVVETIELEIKTPPLPDELQNAVTLMDKKEKAVNGITIVSGGAFRNPYAFDSSGNIRWYLNVETDAHGYFSMNNGRFILIGGYETIETESRDYGTYLYDMDFLGRLHKTYYISNGVHHDIVEKKPDGNLLVLGNSLEGHVEDLVLEIDRDTGDVVNELNLNDIIKDTPYNDAYDWAHTNSISYNGDDNSLILSVRNLSSAIKINWPTGEIQWILSDPKIWKNTNYENYVLKPINETIWHYEEHSVFEMQEDVDNNPDTLDLFVFDNRVIRNPLMDLQITQDPDRSSVTEYAINEKDESVQQLKRFPNLKAYITSNYELFLDQDKLIAYHGSLRENEEGEMWGEIYEYRFSTGELIRSYKTRYGFYRAHRQNFDVLSCIEPIVNDK